ncbi:MAG TPA: hypothetical protein VMB66_08825 [Candidatus Acidoferrales bacterium]|nr:hypothetical protein [Candidatus Acidoferrales bacterium]
MRNLGSSLSIVFLLLSCATPSLRAQESIRATTPPPANANIDVENWTKPERGWLYVLDPTPVAGSGGRILLIDPESGKTAGSIKTGDFPDFALAPDGSRLYVTSVTDGDASELAVIDTAQGTILKSGVVNNRAVDKGMPAFSTMALSRDGAVLRILIETPNPDQPESFMFASFDTRAEEFLPGVVHLGNCGPVRFIDMPAADHFDVLCPRTNRVRLIRVDPDSRTLQNFDVVLPWERREGAATAIRVPGSDKIAIVAGNGGVVEMNAVTEEFQMTAAHPDAPYRVPPATWPTSPDGSRIFLGYNREHDQKYDKRFYLDYGRPPNIRPSNSAVYELRVLDTQTWRKLGTIKTKMPCWSAIMGNDGKLLYALSPQKHSIAIIDTARMQVLRTLKIQGTPALALVAP